MDKIDLLAHKYHPERSDNFSCHLEQATRLKQWIQEFSSGQQQSKQPYEYDDSYSESELTNDSLVRNVKNCVLLSGPPGVGKTSLVYTIANELKLHVIESHPSEKRDSKLFSMLKLTNQKGKINPIAKLFQAAKQQQQEQHISTRIKRRKLAEAPTVNQPQLLSLKSDTSMILFDDIDVVFEEDGPFLKSLVDFIRESKRPVVLTATQSIDYIKQILVNCEHIHLDKPTLESCGKLLTKVCKQENYLKVNRNSRCLSIAEHLNCDIRQCLNTIHFYGHQSDESLDNYLENNYILPEFSRLNLVSECCKNDENGFILDCYTNSSLVDLIDSKLNLINRSILLENWLEGRPSIRNEEYKFEYDLGEQIRESIVELTERVHSSELMKNDDFRKHKRRFRRKMDEFETEVVQRINRKIKSRIEPPEKEFYIDMVPMFSEIVELEAQKKINNQMNGISNGSRRSRRMPSYLDTIEIIPLEQDDIGVIHQGLLDPEDIDNVRNCF